MKIEDILNNPKAEAELEERVARKRRVTQHEHEEYVQTQLFDIFLNWRDLDKETELKEKYNSAVFCLKENVSEISAGEIYNLCDLARGKLESTKELGIFVSAMLNKALKDDKPFVFDSSKYGILDNFGIFLEKGKIVINGSIGENFVINGSIGENCGFGLNGGQISVSGKADKGYGDNMQRGKLEIGMATGSGFNNMLGGEGIINSFLDNGNYCSEFKFENGIGVGQKGGLLKILCDFPRIARGKSRYVVYVEGVGVGFKQEGGEVIVEGDIHTSVSSSQKGGTTHIKGGVFYSGDSTYVGEYKEGGRTIIDGDCKISTEHTKGYVGFEQKGGLIKIKGDVDADVAIHAKPNSTIEIDGNVLGNIGGGYDKTYGTKVLIGGNVSGNVGCNTIHFDCVIKGDVVGDVGRSFGYVSDIQNRKTKGRIEICGQVNGNVGEYMDILSEIVVGKDVIGNVGREMYGGTINVYGGIQGIVGPCYGGKVYQAKKGFHRGNQDVTNTPISIALLKGVLDLFFDNPRRGKM